MKIKIWHKLALTSVSSIAACASGAALISAWADDGQGKADTALEQADPEFQEAIVKHIIKRFCTRIDATAAQKKEITALVEKRREANSSERAALRAGLKDFMHAAGSLENSPESDKSLRDKAASLRVMHEKLMDDRLETFLKIRAMLTSEQKENLKKFAQHRPRLTKAIESGTAL